MKLLDKIIRWYKRVDDADLRRRVEALLTAHANPESYLDQPAAEFHLEVTDHLVTDSQPPGRGMVEKPGTIIGPYKLLQKIGDGGMGVVYMAEQKAPIKRRVALKLVKPGMDTQQVIARFDAERQALALMDHPGIAKVFHRSALDNFRKLAERNPSIPDYREGMAKAHNSIGIIMEDFGIRNEAAREYSSAIAIREPMADKHPDVPEYSKELIKNYGNIARILLKQGDRHAAFDNTNRSVALAEDLATRFVDTPEYGRLLARAYDQLGRCFLESGDYDKAEENFQRELETARDSLDESDDATLCDSEISDTLRNLASLATKRADYAGAEA